MSVLKEKQEPEYLPGLMFLTERNMLYNMCHVMLYNMCHVMLYNMCHDMLYNVCHVMLYNMCRHVMFYNMLCYLIQHVSSYVM